MLVYMKGYLKNSLAKFLLEEKVGRKKLYQEIGSFQFEEERGIEYLKELEDDGISVIAFDEKAYPEYLKQLNDFPILLFVKGKKELLSKDLFTIVGTREMTQYGSDVVEEFLDKQKDICFVSGLARGIDSKVHSTCLEGKIPTIAIVAGGIYEGFPRSNIKLFEQICREGLVISEFPPGRSIIKGMFPMRNRILAGISMGTLVVESGIKGGSRITARLALEYGRDVFSVPGNIFSESSKGCNLLISQGANSVSSREEFDLLLEDCIHRGR
jgi:DNA processing protein